jgi:hypothetical protein
LVFPYDSVFYNSETETVALNIMKILSRTGDNFRSIDWEEYKAERIKDGNFTESEKEYFVKVIPYFRDYYTVALFSSEWRK